MVFQNFIKKLNPSNRQKKSYDSLILHVQDNLIVKILWVSILNNLVTLAWIFHALLFRVTLQIPLMCILQSKNAQYTNKNCLLLHLESVIDPSPCTCAAGAWPLQHLTDPCNSCLTLAAAAWPLQRLTDPCNSCLTLIAAAAWPQKKQLFMTFAAAARPLQLLPGSCQLHLVLLTLLCIIINCQ